MNIKIFFLLFCLIQITAICYGQWLLESSYYHDSLLYQLKKKDIIQGEKVRFKFPAYKYWVKNKTHSAVKATLIKKTTLGNIQGEYLGVIIAPNTGIVGQTEHNAVLSSIYMNLSVYAINIKSIFLYVKLDGDISWQFVQKKEMDSKLTYQGDFSFKIPIDRSLIPDLERNINEIRILGLTYNKNISPELIIGNLAIKNKVTKKKVFYSSLNENIIKNIQKKPYFKKNNGIFKEIPYVCKKNFNNPDSLKLIFPDNINKSFDSIKYVGTFFQNLLGLYQHYELKSLDKSKVLNKNLSLIENSTSLKDYYKSFNRLLVLLNDVHFQLKLPKNETKTILPVYFNFIEDSFEVTAVFDTTLAQHIKNGDRLVAINNIQIDTLINLISDEVYAASKTQRIEKTALKLLELAYIYFQDTLLALNIIRSNSCLKYTYNIDSASIYKNYISEVPENFIPSTRHKNIRDIAYLYINKFDYNLIPFWHSYLDSIKDSNALIIDLRSNPGGDLSSLYLSTFFLKKQREVAMIPMKFIDQLFNPDTPEYQKIIVRPDKRYYYKKTVILLINSRTTCSAEFFINTLKKYGNNIIIMGASNTAGQAQFLKHISLPPYDRLNPELSFYLNKTFDAYGNDIDESRGIHPDLLIDISSYKDLMPYKDKILQKAISFFKKCP